MIESIRLDVTVPLTGGESFASFAERLGSWWPHEYTWSQQVLRTIGLEPHTDGLCFEIGPHGFRCDWGRVLAWEPPHKLVFAWQISPRREPVPDPRHASTVEVTIRERSAGSSVLTLEHRDFERHGDGATDYRAALASPEGWPHILEAYTSFCERGI